MILFSDIGQAVAIRQNKGVRIDIPGNPLQTSTGHRFPAGIRKTNVEILF